MARYKSSNDRKQQSARSDSKAQRLCCVGRRFRNSPESSSFCLSECVGEHRPFLTASRDLLLRLISTPTAAP
eukprot:2295357-Pleurochrysis_carterae.AAC.1